MWLGVYPYRYICNYVYDLISICIYICICSIYYSITQRKVCTYWKRECGFPRKTTEPTNVPWKSMVGRYISYWNSPSWKNISQFSGVYLSYWFCPCDSLVSPLLFQFSFQNTHTHKKNASVLCSFAGMNQFITSSGGLKITGFGWNEYKNWAFKLCMCFKLYFENILFWFWQISLKWIETWNQHLGEVFLQGCGWELAAT